MPRQVNMQAAEIEQGRTEIFFHFILLLPLVLDGSNKRAPVYYRNIKRLHDANTTAKLLSSHHFHIGLCTDDLPR
jgi:hypothetical protein